MKHHDQELAKMMLYINDEMNQLKETNDYFSRKSGKLMKFLVNNGIEPFHVGKSATDIAIEEIKRLKEENEHLEEEIELLRKELRMRG